MTPHAFDNPSVLRQGTLTGLRWFAVIGQMVVLVTVHFGFGFELPLAPVLLAVAAAVWINLYATLSFSPARPLSHREIVAFLSFDTLQISAILFLTGGVQNPFALWLIMQAMLAASSVPRRMALGVIALVVACYTVLSIWHYPLPWRTEDGFSLPQIYNIGIWIALVMGVGFTSAYAYRVARERTKLTEALSATQMALSREERLTALDGLAAAAAHELGTPLGTIQVTAREMERELPDGPLKEDASLLISQTQRCQRILQRLSEAGQAGDMVHNVISLDALLREAARPFMQDEEDRVSFRFDPESGALPEKLQRRPEIIYGLRNLIENANKYASSHVEISAMWRDGQLDVTISDDGPGIPHETMMRLGEPYPGSSGRRENAKGGLGLGFFIAKTLLERTGGVLRFGNNQDRTGAWVTVSWPLAELSEGTKSRENTLLGEAYAT
ncbi:ActS/PrrB/RegB family redox-sensitive histidine kinase [Parvularcula sp. ZS-1/3]|uniref:histidine kinase n=1 Tax=Parvularcula mediterranea TaxID=2732508 RepID=A0A7Y3RLE7_9PROT|nr:ActS/PrrB/RegB family redox-sensitive histidine kinase [Parvularcula mediterranea]NNU15750.1 ActS/PrrB/RegB family redox-sensitive histidine kinase [Parvularcula mediterranea]